MIEAKLVWYVRSLVGVKQVEKLRKKMKNKMFNCSLIFFGKSIRLI